MPETIYKLQPHRTMHLRGFDRRGAAAALHSASATGFTVSGVFRDPADFAVLVLYDADDFFGHPRWRYLPDFDFSGMVLEFDVAFTNLQPLDSPKFASIDWPFLDAIRADGSTAQVKLWDYASKVGGTFGKASRTWTLAGNPVAFDRVSLWYQNLAFDKIVETETAEQVGQIIRDQINNTNWVSAAPPVALRASGSGRDVVTTAARYGVVNTSGTAVTWVSGDKFTGLEANETIRIGTIPVPGGTEPEYTIASVSSPTSLTVVENPGAQTGVHYLADRAGEDGNHIELYTLSKNNNFLFSPGSGKLTGGSSAATWRVRLDFSALGLASIRKMWLTFAPKLANGAAYADSEWSAAFTNWSVADPQGKRALKVAGAGSVRVGSADRWAAYTGAWAAEAGFYWRGFARKTATPADKVVVEYHCQASHDLYVGASLYKDRGIFEARLDGDAATDLDGYLNDEPAVVTRRKVRSAVAAGKHSLELKLKAAKNAASSGFNMYFDYLEAVAAGDAPDAPAVYTDRSAATDYDTDHSYKLAPARLAWQIERSGLRGDINHYLGVFWWNQRKRAGGTFPAMEVTFAGVWASGDSVFLTIGGITIGKSVFPQEDESSIAAHFRRFINETFVGVWASESAGILTITCRSPLYSFTFSHTKNSAGGTVSASGSLEGGVEGTWEIDAAAAPVINRAARDWHNDFFAQIAAKGWTATGAFSMELVDPPDAPASGQVWSSRYRDGQRVLTATGFASLLSTHCAFSDKVVDYQKKAYKELADSMSAAGLVPWLQFGEFLWWFFSNYDAASNPNGGMAFYDAYTASQAQAALGRALAAFLTPNDDPALNAYADANFLRGRIKSHIDTIRTHVLASHAGGKFELLWPLDVNEPQTERLNRYVNLPGEYENKGTSGLDRLKMEGLAFGSVERNLFKALETVRFPYTTPLGWARQDARYLLPWFNGGCPWVEEFLLAGRERVGGLVFWAWDHLNLLGWGLPLPGEERRSRVTVS
ncbi:MAG: hypothetical protein FJW37_06605 [Acidobacteria bacterium]|nr:hypothetical protein [Acidobacteriota bacterium]